MKTKKILRALVIFLILSSTIGCDQVSKHIVRQRIDAGQQIGFLNNYVTLMKVENKGAFLSVGDSLSKPIRMLLLTILPFAALGLALIFLFTKNNLSNLTILGISLIVGGGIGNIYDRVRYDSVTDFLHIDFVIFQTGVFNMADVSIMAGMCVVILNGYFKAKIEIQRV